MRFQKLKQKCKENEHAVMASMKMNGDIFIYVNPDASAEEILKSMTILGVNVAKHIEETRK